MDKYLKCSDYVNNSDIIKYYEKTLVRQCKLEQICNCGTNEQFKPNAIANQASVNFSIKNNNKCSEYFNKI